MNFTKARSTKQISIILLVAIFLAQFSFAVPTYANPPLPIGEDVYEQDDTRELATLIPTTGIIQPHTIDANDDWDWVKFETVAGQTYTVNVSDWTNNLVISIYLYGPDGSYLTSDSIRSSNNIKLVWTPETTGTYYARIGSWINGTGEYNLRVEPSQEDATLKSISIDGQPLDNFYRNSEDYNVQLPPGTISVPSVTVEKDAYNASVNITNASQIPGITTIDVTAADGTTTKTYSLSFSIGDAYEPDDSKAAAKLISTDGTPQTHTLNPDDIDWVKFEAIAGKNYTISTSDLTDNVNTYIFLYSSESNTGSLTHNGNNKDDLTSKIDWNAPASGLYYIFVTGSAGQYDIAVTQKSSGGGGGGSGAPVNPKPEAPLIPGQGVDLSGIISTNLNTGPDGSITDVASLSETKLEQILQTAADKDFVLEVKGQAAAKQVVIPLQAMEKLAAKEANLLVKTAEATLNIPAGVINANSLATQLGVDPAKVEVKINIKAIPEKTGETYKQAANKDKALNPLTKVLEFTLEATAGEKSVEVKSFGDKTVKGEFPLQNVDIQKVKDNRKLNVYKYNDNSGQWEYVPSKFVDGKVIFSTTTFSKYTVMEYNKSFTDVVSYWAKDEIELLASKYIVRGVTSTAFAPESRISRAEFTSLLVRALGLKGVMPVKARFKDVPSGKWYYSDIETAAQVGLVHGFKDNTFKPDDYLSRAEMAALTNRSLKLFSIKGEVTASEINSILVRFKDQKNIQSWAREDVALGIKLGVIKGKGENFAPGFYATRAESTVVIKRLMEKAGKI